MSGFAEPDAPLVGGESIEQMLDRLKRSGRVRHRLPDEGRLRIERELPYLLVYRQPADGQDEGTVRLVLGEASYLITRGDAEGNRIAAGVVRELAARLAREYGAFLVLEIWAAAPGSEEFRILCPEGEAPATVARLEEVLGELESLRRGLSVRLSPGPERHPSGLPPLLPIEEAHRIGCLVLGLEVPAVYRDAGTGAAYPVFLRAFRRAFSRVLRQALFEFIRVQTNAGVDNFRVLGTRTVDDAVWRADEQLAEVERSYSFLLLLSPVNSQRAWTEFRDSGFERDPEFHYRLLPMDPDVLKRKLYEIELGTLEDPTLAHLLREKREELDRQITLLAERNTPAFLQTSNRLYGTVEAELLAAARELLAALPLRPGLEDAGSEDDEEGEEGGSNGAGRVGAGEFATLAREEFAYYRAIYPEFSRKAQVRPDLLGLMVSDGNLLIGETLSLPPARLDALLQHEVGTHVLTYVNGSAQPLRQLRHGLAGYDELQEGLAVFAEYLVGGLSSSRMRLLGGRVVAADAVIGGAQFQDTFRLLRAEHGFTPGTAFRVAERVHQGGGYTRDLIYLRGLFRLLEYLANGGALEPLYVGKMAQGHIDAIRELRDRGVLGDPPLTPRFLLEEGAARRLERAKQGLRPVDLVSQ